MNTAGLITALGLPADARVDQRVPKKLLLENGAPTATDKRYITEGIEELFWVAALKPTTIGVPDYRDEVREYLEIAVLGMRLHTGARAGRLIELVHRAVPYPVLLLAEQGGYPGISAAHKRWSQGEAGKTVLDGDIVTIEWDDAYGQSFSEALALCRQPNTTLYALYQGWIDTLLAFQAAHVTGVFFMPVTSEHAAARREALQECVRLEAEAARLRAAAVKEKQFPRQVELNLEIKRVQAAQEAARARL